MESMLASPKMAGLMGTFDNFRGKLNMVTLVTSFVLSIMVINNYRQCQSGKGYPKDHGFVSMSYGVSVAILIICVLLFSMDIFQMVMKKMR